MHAGRRRGFIFLPILNDAWEHLKWFLVDSIGKMGYCGVVRCWRGTVRRVSVVYGLEPV